MKKMAIFHISMILFAAILGIFLSGCGEKAVPIGGIIDSEEAMDGIYEGSYKAGPNKAIVKVTIKDGKITDVEIIKHDAWKGKKAEPVIPKSIVENQSTKVDAVSGATNSSYVIMNAAQKAIEKAYGTSSTSPE